MPVRVKCLHVLVAHCLAVGPGRQPVRRRGARALAEWWAKGPASTPTTRSCRASGPAREGRAPSTAAPTRSACWSPTSTGRPARPTSTARCASCGSGRASTAPASWRPEALERTRVARVDYAATCRRARRRAGAHGRHVRARRDARNRDDFIAVVREARSASPPEVVSGDEEAALSFDGATPRARPARQGPFLVIDIGGGSTELVLGTTRAEAALSVDVGCVRLTERHLLDDPPTARAGARPPTPTSTPPSPRAARAVASSRRARRRPRRLGHDRRRASPSAWRPTTPSASTCRASPSADVARRRDALLAMTRAERAALPVMHPGRVDVIGAGALVSRAARRRLGLADVVRQRGRHPRRDRAEHPQPHRVTPCPGGSGSVQRRGRWCVTRDPPTLSGRGAAFPSRASP